MSTRWARLTRGLLAALFSTFVAACSHTLSGGSIPSLVGLALCLAFSTVLCTLLAGKTLSLLRLSISIGVSQFAFHGAFSLLADAAPSSMPMPGMHDHAAGAMSMHLDQVSATPHAAMSADPGMWLGHAVAAMITIVAFRFGEAAFWALLELTLLRITRLALYAHRVQPIARLRPSVVAAERAQIPRPVDHVLSALRHRGPPAVVMA